MIMNKSAQNDKLLTVSRLHQAMATHSFAHVDEDHIRLVVCDRMGPAVAFDKDPPVVDKVKKDILLVSVERQLLGRPAMMHLVLLIVLFLPAFQAFRAASKIMN